MGEARRRKLIEKLTAPYPKDNDEARHLGAAFHRGIKEDIERCGRSVVCVPDGDPSFAYTIGNWLRLLPELLCIIPARDITELVGSLNHASDIQRDRGKAFPDSELVSLDGKYPVKFINATTPHVKRTYTIQAGQHFHHQIYEVRQMLIPDREGRFPGDPLCNGHFAQQLTIGCNYEASSPA